jgi:hypothetical protein
VRKAVLLGLVVVLLIAGLAAAGCGGSSTDPAAVAAVQASAAKVDAAIKDLTAQGTTGALTVAGIKTARDGLKPEVQSIIDNGKKIKGADTAAVQKAWTDLDAAVTALPDTATLMDAAGVLMTKVTPLKAAIAAVTALVTPTS